METRDKRFIGPDEASKLLGVPKSWIYRASSNGKFPKDIVFHVGKYLRIDSERLIAHLKAEGKD